MSSSCEKIISGAELELLRNTILNNDGFSYTELKEMKFRKRKNLTSIIKFMEVAKRNYKKKLCVTNDNGNHYTLICSERGCAFSISCKSAIGENHNIFWSISERKLFPECLNHSEFCLRRANVGPRLLSEVLSKLCPEILCDGSTYAELLTRLRLEYGISLGSYGFHVGQNPSANVAVCRLKKYITNILHGNDAQLIEKLPSLLRQFETLNPGCKTFVDATENGVFKRCAVITQRSIIYFQTDYVRKLFSIDCGFWKSGVGKEYKLLLIFGSTGNNTNLTVLWAIVDGETKDNRMWAMDCLSEAGSTPTIPTSLSYLMKVWVLSTASRKEHHYRRNFYVPNIGSATTRAGVREMHYFGTSCKTVAPQKSIKMY